MLRRNLLILCCLLAVMVIPVYAHDGEMVSETERIVAGLGVVIFGLGILSVVFKRNPEESEED